MSLSSWTIEVLADGVRFRRIHEGQVVETYGVVSREKAYVYAAAIIGGLQPPRDLRDQGPPIG